MQAISNDLMSATMPTKPTKLASFADPMQLAAEVESLRAELALKDAAIKEMECHNAKLEAGISHRDAVIAQLASSRKLVFEECHKACINNQAELRQMQDALHRVSRLLQRERREHAIRIKELRKTVQSSSSSFKTSKTTATALSDSLTEVFDSEDSWEVDCIFEASPTGLCMDEGVDCIITPTTPVRTPSSHEDDDEFNNMSGSPPPPAPRSPDKIFGFKRSASPEQGDEVDYLTW